MRNNYPSVIDELPYSALTISRKGMERLDLLLLAIESLEINASATMISIAKNLGLADIFPNSVELWKKRCYNPYRKAFRRGCLTNQEVEAFVLLISSMAERLYPYIRQLLSSKESQTLNQQRWDLINEKMDNLIANRMNLRKAHVLKLLKPENRYIHFRQIIISLSLASGPGGIDRLRASLFDPS